MQQVTLCGGTAVVIYEESDTQKKTEGPGQDRAAVGGFKEKSRVIMIGVAGQIKI